MQQLLPTNLTHGLFTADFILANIQFQLFLFKFFSKIKREKYMSCEILKTDNSKI